MAKGDRNDSSTQGSGRRLSPRAVGGIALGVVALVFIFSNNDDANVSFLFFDATLALWLVLTLTFGLGLAVGTLVLGRARYKPSKK